MKNSAYVIELLTTDYADEEAGDSDGSVDSFVPPKTPYKLLFWIIRRFQIFWSRVPNRWEAEHRCV